MRDKRKPLFHWYVDCALGKELVFALYTRPCRHGRCVFCALPNLSLDGESVSARDIEGQIDYILDQYSQEERDSIAKVSIYTASSVLDQECMPTRSLLYLSLRVCDLPKLSMVSLETRVEYVEDWELKALRNLFGESVTLEIGIGYETHSPDLRNRILGKGLTVKELNIFMKLLAENGASMKAYLMLKPHHSLTEEEGIVEAQNGLKELHGLGSEYGVPVSIHLNPTYIAKGCRLTEELIEHGYKPPELASVLTVVQTANDLGLPIYVGLDDEGLAIEGGTFRSSGLDRDLVVGALQSFNRHQDLDRLLKESGYTPENI